MKDVICYYSNENKATELVVHFFTFSGKLYIHKIKYLKSVRRCNIFLLEIKYLIKSLELVNTKTNAFLQLYNRVINCNP